MNFLLEQHQKFLIQLIDFDVEFILVGGYAVNFHGYNRSTGDMDLWLRPSNSNQQKLIQLFIEMGFEPSDLVDLKNADFNSYLVFSIWDQPFRIDFLTRVSGIDFETAWAHKVFLPLKDKLIPVLHLHDLILTKISNSRPQDKADVSELQKIEAYKNTK